MLISHFYWFLFIKEALMARSDWLIVVVRLYWDGWSWRAHTHNLSELMGAGRCHRWLMKETRQHGHDSGPTIAVCIYMVIWWYLAIWWYEEKKLYIKLSQFGLFLVSLVQFIPVGFGSPLVCSSSHNRIWSVLVLPGSARQQSINVIHQ